MYKGFQFSRSLSVYLPLSLPFFQRLFLREIAAVRLHTIKYQSKIFVQGLLSSLEFRINRPAIPKIVQCAKKILLIFFVALHTIQYQKFFVTTNPEKFFPPAAGQKPVFRTRTKISFLKGFPISIKFWIEEIVILKGKKKITRGSKIL